MRAYRDEGEHGRDAETGRRGEMKPRWRDLPIATACQMGTKAHAQRFRGGNASKYGKPVRIMPR